MVEMSVRSDVIETRATVLQNTYRLLSMTLVLSAITAYVGMIFPVGGLGMLGIFVLSFILLFATRANSNSGLGVLLLFGFTGLMGYSLGPTLNHYVALPHGSEIVGTALLATGAAFLGLSAYVQVTKKDFAFLGGFLFIALIGLIIVSIVGMFFPTPMLSLGLAYVSALIFSGYILYDTSDIISGRETNYIMATMRLYLNILNLFLALLRIVAGSRD
ncbi:MAG TPA: Bax inhibitor-1 family protein [Burkholderiaceae bacterium]|jgi:modulator of FtsH protease|nr:Bax inhibitor-1 family protein [Burkholderiaceae bacterium]